MNGHCDCILFATADWDHPYWTNKQHTAQHLSRRGYRILYVESVGLRSPNLGSGRDLSRLWRRLLRGLAGPRQVDERLWVLSPLVIPFKHQWRLVRCLNRNILRWALYRFTRRQGFQAPVIWTYHPFMLGALPGGRQGPLVYHCVDDLAAVPGIDAEAFNCEERRLLARADHVFTTTPALRDKCIVHSHKVMDFPNVADVEHFRQAHAKGELPPELAAIPEPRIAYVGVLSDFKVDFDLALNIAERRPDWHWVFIGEEREGQRSTVVERLKALPNVHFLGFIPYSRLPEYLRGMQVATLPTLLNDYTRAMFPMKYFEYLAAGTPVVATRLDFTRNHTAGLEVADDALGFERAIERSLARGKFTLEESLAFVGENTWDARLDKMLQILE